MKRMIIFDGQPMELEATADTLRAYRDLFGSDLLRDLTIHETIHETLERLTYVMAAACDMSLVDIETWQKRRKSPFAMLRAADSVLGLWNESMQSTVRPAKQSGSVTVRENTTALFLLRALQLGLTMADLRVVTVGMVIDMMIEHGNDSNDYPIKAGQAEIDAFKRS